LETLIRDAWMLSLGASAEQLVNEDLASQLSHISKQMDPTKAAAWILEIEDMREQLIRQHQPESRNRFALLMMASGAIPTKRVSVK
jgi:hypothetical protein